MLDKNNPITPVCDTGIYSPCVSVDIYYASGTVRIRHTNSYPGTNGYVFRNFRLSNFPTASFAILNQNVVVLFQLYDAYQVIM